jgi:hypothetical protein
VFFFFARLCLAHSRSVIIDGEEGRADRANKRDREGGDDSGGESSAECVAVLSSLQTAEAELEALKALRDTKLQVLVDAFNVYLKKRGFPLIHKKDERDASAYFRCSCRGDGCFKVTFALSAAPKSGRKVAREWFVKSIGEHACEPREPRGVAIANTWIPESIKELLMSLFNQGIGAAAAFTQSVHRGDEIGLPTTWEKSDVENFFDTVRRLFCSDDIIAHLKELTAAGHFVAVDRKTLPDGRSILNLAFVAFKSMQLLFHLFGSFASIDATYGKNNLQLPVAFFVGLSNEGCIIPFGVGFLRSETTESYTWLARMFYECYKSLPRTIVMDGDLKIRAAIDKVASEKGEEMSVLLCVWHLYKDLEKQLQKKTPGVDVFALKRSFYELRSCVSKAAFEEKWVIFTGTYGKDQKSLNYLQTQLYTQRKLWVQAWTGRTFCGGMQTSGISESLHSLLASGQSATLSLSDVLQLVDRILLSQCDKSLKLAAAHEKTLEGLTLASLAGFVTLSVATLLSGQAWTRLVDLNVNSCFLSVEPIDRVDAFATRSWRVTDLRFASGSVHMVSEIAVPAAGARYVSAATVIRRVLSKNVDLGHHVCAVCAAGDDGARFDAGGGFQLPARWELLYQGVFERKRLCIALGFNVPKEAGSTNNSTHEGLLDMLKLYVAGRDRRLKAGLLEREAHVEACNEMREHQYGGRELGVPHYKPGLWIKCGVADGEDAVPEAERRRYCGLWFHAACVGLMRAPEDGKERIQCLQCMQDARYRVKPPKVEQVAKAALWDAHGVPRILENEAGGRISTLFLDCKCKLAIGMGLPCEGMLAIARTCGAVLSFRHFNPHWFGGKMIEFDAPKAVLDKNKKVQLNVEEVVGHRGAEEAPSHVPEQLRPKRAKVARGDKAGQGAPSLVVTEGGVELGADGPGLEGLVAGDAKSDTKRSRRYKSSKK